MNKLSTFYSQSWHGIPSALNAGSNILLKQYTNDDAYGIQVFNHPLPKNALEKVKKECLFASLCALQKRSKTIFHLMVQLSSHLLDIYKLRIPNPNFQYFCFHLVFSFIEQWYNEFGKLFGNGCIFYWCQFHHFPCSRENI